MWSVYILKCSDDSFYTGITNNITRRIIEHNRSNSVGSKFTRTRRPVLLVYCQLIGTRREAIKRENEIKKLSRKDKYELIEGRVAQR